MLLSACALLSATGPALPQQAQWPGWRGPDGSGVIESATPPIEWGENLNLRWKVELPGRGLSSPTVWGEHVFVTAAVSLGDPPEGPYPPPTEGDYLFPLDEQEFHLMALSRADGSVAWDRALHSQVPHQSVHRDGSFATPTVVTDGRRLYASFGSFGIFATTMDGEPIWNTDLGDMDVFNSFGEGSSPALTSDAVVVAWEHNGGESFLAALDKASGEERWRVPLDTQMGWASPLVVEGKTGPQVVMCGPESAGYDAATGEVVWSYDLSSEKRRSPQQLKGGVVASPAYRNGILVYTTGSARGKFVAIRVSEAEGDLEQGDAVLWTADGNTPEIPSPIAAGGVLYSLKNNAGIVSAFDLAGGQRLFGPQRMLALGESFASPVAAGEHLIFLSRDGTAEVLARGREFRSVAINKLEDTFAASPAVAGDELYLRGSTFLYCVADEDDGSETVDED